MGVFEHVPMVRCRLSGPDEAEGSLLRYIPLAEFELWRYLMETRHGRSVSVEEVSIWVSEQAAWWNSGYAPETLEPVLRVRFERPGPQGVPVPIERFFPAETYPQAQEALLAHYDGAARARGVMATPGYFVVSESARQAARGA
jgi:hypothetical protein